MDAQKQTNQLRSLNISLCKINGTFLVWFIMALSIRYLHIIPKR
jgi:hypothetical protein